MKFPETSYGLRIELDAKECQLQPATLEQFEKGLAPLRRPVEHFPVKDLYITVYFHKPTQDYRVKTALVLPGRTLATGDLDENLYTAFERCVRKLMQKLEEFKSRLENEGELSKYRKGTHHDVNASFAPDEDLLAKAVADSDYQAFRRATYAYEDSLTSRIGRWVARYPQLEAKLGDGIVVSDVVEEVFLNAFERFDSRPTKLAFGEWLEQLIDPSIKLLLKNPEEELQNISFIRSMNSAAGET